MPAFASFVAAIADRLPHQFDPHPSCSNPSKTRCRDGIELARATSNLAAAAAARVLDRTRVGRDHALVARSHANLDLRGNRLRVVKTPRMLSDFCRLRRLRS